MARNVLALVLVVVVAGLAAAIFWGGPFDTAAFLPWIAANPALAAGLLVLGHSAAAVFALPSWVFLVMFGYLFGLPGGLALGWLSTIAASAASFAVGRYLARPWVSSRLARIPRLAALDLAVRRRGFPIVLLSRLSLVLPMHLVSYVYAVSGVGAMPYLCGTALGLIPAVGLYVTLGVGASDIARLIVEGAPPSPLSSALVLVGVLIAVAVTIWLARLSNQLLDEAVAGSETADPEEGAAKK